MTKPLSERELQSFYKDIFRVLSKKKSKTMREDDGYLIHLLLKEIADSHEFQYESCENVSLIRIQSFLKRILLTFEVTKDIQFFLVKNRQDYISKMELKKSSTISEIVSFLVSRW